MMSSFISSLTALFSVSGAATVLAAFSAFATIVMLGLPLVRGGSLDRRMKQIAALRTSLRDSDAAGDASPRRALRRNTLWHRVERPMGKVAVATLASPRLKAMLKQAGLRGPRPLAAFAATRVGAPLVMGPLVWLYLTAVMPGSAMQAVMLSAAAAGMSVFLPHLLAANLVARRRAVLARAFPDGLDLLVICVEAGVSIEMALNKVADEINGVCPALAEEFWITTAELSYLGSRRRAYENLASRTGLPGIKSLCLALIQAEDYGTPLAQALRVMARENREMRLSEADRKAAALPPKLTVPMIVFFLPVLFVVILGPAALRFLSP